MATYRMLALKGEADGSVLDFLDLVEGTDAIGYWDTSLPGSAPITTATEGIDYTLDYLTEGDLDGYTALTVFTPVPKPTTLALALIGLGVAIRHPPLTAGGAHTSFSLSFLELPTVGPTDRSWPNAELWAVIKTSAVLGLS